MKKILFSLFLPLSLFADSLSLLDSATGLSEITVSLNEPFKLTIEINAARPILGLSYRLSAIVPFTVRERFLGFTPFTDTIRDNVVGVSLKDYLTVPVDFGALVDNEQPGVIGTINVAEFTFDTLGIPVGTYYIFPRDVVSVDSNLDGENVVGNAYTVNVIPESPTVCLWALGAGMLAFKRRRVYM